MSTELQSSQTPLEQEIELFLKSITHERKLSRYTCRNYGAALKLFYIWLRTYDASFINQITAIHKNHIRSFLIEQQQRVGRKTLHNYASALRAFFKFLVRQKKRLNTPLQGVFLPKLEKTLPKFLTEKQITHLLEMPQQLLRLDKCSAFQACRDRVILELLYGAGFRISELIQLTYEAIDFTSGIAHVTGKGNKERLCPLGKAALYWLGEFKKSLKSIPSAHPTYICIHETGELISMRLIQLNLKKYLQAAGLPLDMTPHKIRHSYATHLLNNGADLRVVQSLLGHANLRTTQIYTHVDVQHLKAIHAATHPRN